MSTITILNHAYLAKDKPQQAQSLEKKNKTEKTLEEPAEEETAQVHQNLKKNQTHRRETERLFLVKAKYCNRKRLELLCFKHAVGQFLGRQTCHELWR